MSILGTIIGVSLMIIGGTVVWHGPVDKSYAMDWLVWLIGLALFGGGVRMAFGPLLS